MENINETFNLGKVKMVMVKNEFEVEKNGSVEGKNMDNLNTTKKPNKKLLKLLEEYNIEVKITERKTSKKVFEWRKGRGNLRKGLIKTNEFALQKLGCELEDIIDTLE